MDAEKDTIGVLQRATLTELWVEIGKRFRIQYGKINMAFHNGRPSEYAELEMKVRETELPHERLPRK